MNQSTFISPAFWKPFMFSFSFCPHFIHYVSQTHTALSAFCCCCRWLFTARQQIAFCWVLLHQTSMSNAHSHARAYTDNTHTVIIHVFCFSFLMHLALFLFVFCISSFYVLLTAEWHRQVSWLGQFGWYNCYYQHPTFRRIPGSHTNLSNLMLKWNQAL